MSNKQIEQRFLEQLIRLQKRQNCSIARKKNLLKRVIGLAKQLDEKNENTNSMDLVRGQFRELL